MVNNLRPCQWNLKTPFSPCSGWMPDFLEMAEFQSRTLHAFRLLQGPTNNPTERAKATSGVCCLLRVNAECCAHTFHAETLMMQALLRNVDPHA